MILEGRNMRITSTILLNNLQILHILLNARKHASDRFDLSSAKDDGIDIPKVVIGTLFRCSFVFALRGGGKINKNLREHLRERTFWKEGTDQEG